MRITLRKYHGVFGAVLAGRPAARVGSSAHAPPSVFGGLVRVFAPLLVLVIAGLFAVLGSADAAQSVAAAPTDDSLMLFAGVLGVYDTAELTGTVNSLIGRVQGLHAKFFSDVKTSEAETIIFDIDEKKRYLAPYVHPKSPGKLRDLRNFRSDSFRPAYIKQLTGVDPSRAMKRQMGEALMGEDSPQTRMDNAVTRELEDHREYIDNRLEQQAIEGLQLGQVTVTGEDYPTTVVNFGRHASLNVAANTLAGVNLWSAATADPLKNFRAWSKKSVKLSGSVLRNFIMDSDAYDGFRGLEAIDKKFNVARIDPGALNTNEAQTEGLILRGECDGHLIWTYDGWYVDDSGTEVSSLEGGRVIGVGAIDGITHFGAIRDLEAGLKALPIFAKSKVNWNPSSLELLTQSAPLVVPQRINACLCAQVL